MTVLSDYHYFLGRHWETGSVCNHWAYQGFKAPHTGQPFSEALLMGISGGIVMGYFSFAYEGYDPQARVLTRNTFDPLERLLERLGVVQHLRQTPDPARAARYLREELESGIPPIVWADYFSLPYNALPYDEGMWGMFPLVVYGYDEAANRAWIADRARAPLQVTLEELAVTRGRVKAHKHRLLTLEHPDLAKLQNAVRMGVADTVRLFTEAPPKGTRKNFGFAAYQWWIELLTRPKARLSWEREFPAGAKMYSGLRWVFEDINTFGKDGCAERDLYANFLDEASLLLNKPGLRQAAVLFRDSALAWDQLSTALLPDETAPLGEARRLLLQRHHLFLEQDSEALEGMRQVDARLAEIKAQVSEDFPLDAAGVIAFRQNLAGHIQCVHDIEVDAVKALQEAMA
jgi:hypothetical protein